MNVIEKINSGFTLLDGAMGTELQKLGLNAGELPERWNIINPTAVENIHKAYLEAGSDIILANTFGANLLKFEVDELEKVISAALNCAKRAVSEYSNIKPRFVALDIGPLGKLLKPLGDLDFEKAVEIFSTTVKRQPPSGIFSTLISPFSKARIRLTRARPRPLPSDLWELSA